MTREQAHFWATTRYLADLHYLTLRSMGHNPEEAARAVMFRVEKHILSAYYSLQQFDLPSLRAELLDKR